MYTKELEVIFLLQVNRVLLTSGGFDGIRGRAGRGQYSMRRPVIATGPAQCRHQIQSYRLRARVSSLRGQVQCSPKGPEGK